jgi:Arc/MetJ-type ribon-helix-helix transcriptional regulator
MQLSLRPDIEKFIAKEVKSGRFASAEDMVTAAILSLKQEELFGDFAPGEMNELLAEGERSIETEGTIDGDTAFRNRRKRRAQRKRA